MDQSAVIFDLGGVVLDWVPARAYEQVMAPQDVPAFMDRIGFHDWNRSTDAGRSFAVAEAELIERFPADAVAIRGYRAHFEHTLTGMVPGTSAIIAELGRAGVPIAALTNWSGETFPIARARFGILARFGDIVVSGDERVAKPDPAIFALACERSGLDPARTVFVDDSPSNVAAASDSGLHGLVFRGADQLRGELVELGLLDSREVLRTPLFHWAPRVEWERAVTTGAYPWSSRDLDYEREGFVHCSFAHQLARTRTKFYADLAESDLVLLRLDPSELPVVVEDGFPHLFAPLPVAAAEVRRPPH